MRKPRGLKVRRYTARLLDVNEYLAVFPGSNTSDKICIKEINENLLSSMPNRWIKYPYVQVFDFKFINFKASVNIFECMEVAESIFEGIL